VEIKRGRIRRVKYWQISLAILAALAASLALAEDVKTIDGKEYKNAKVNRVEPDGIVITHSAGVAKIPFTELPKDVQERFGYDSAEIEGERAAARAAEEKRIEEQKAAERERAEREQNAKANLMKAQEQFEAAEKQAAESYKRNPKGTLSGQGFVATKGGENFKLGALQVSLFAREAIDVLLAGLKAYADAMIEQMPLSAETKAEEHAKAAAQQARAAVEQAKAVEEQAKAAAQQAKAKEKADWTYYQQVPGSNEARRNAEAAREAANAAKEAVNTAAKAASAAREAVDTAQRAAGAARGRYNALLEEKAVYYSAAFYFDHLRSPIQTAETDGDGKFVMEIPPTGAFVIDAQGERNVSGEKTERYHWLQPVSLEGQQQRTQNLSNNNLTRTTGTSSLVLTVD
jgi:hypothetical protein